MTIAALMSMPVAPPGNNGGKTEMSSSEKDALLLDRHHTWREHLDELCHRAQLPKHVLGRDQQANHPLLIYAAVAPKRPRLPVMPLVLAHQILEHAVIQTAQDQAVDQRNLDLRQHRRHLQAHQHRLDLVAAFKKLTAVGLGRLHLVSASPPRCAEIAVKDRKGIRTIGAHADLHLLVAAVITTVPIEIPARTVEITGIVRLLKPSFMDFATDYCCFVLVLTTTIIICSSIVTRITHNNAHIHTSSIHTNSMFTWGCHHHRHHQRLK